MENKLKTNLIIKQIDEYLNSPRPFNHFKYNNIIYSINDILLIKSASSSESFFSLGRLIRIIHRNGISSNPKWPSIEVEWFYQKSEIIRSKVNSLNDDNYYESISDDEVFSSNHRDIIFIETVEGKAKVVSIDEYIETSDEEKNVFFTRAAYNPFNLQISPPIEKWTKYCYCKMPFNPNLLYVKCDKCEKWFHVKCVGVKEDEVNEAQSFFCRDCL